MKLDINTQQLLNLIKSFYDLSGIKIAIYDNYFKEILSYPQENSDFCKLMERSSILHEKCNECSAKLCNKCAMQKKTIVYKCHAGLTEVISPINVGDVTVGYIIYGQITNTCDREQFIADVKKNCAGYGLSEEEMDKCLLKTKYCSDSEINATLEIINAVTLYIVYKGFVYVSESPLGMQIADYINKNPADDLSISSLCRRFAVSKAKLYSVSKLYMPEGVAKYVRRRRIEAAQDIIRKNPGKPVWKVAEEVGFDDYEYFLRVFKRETGKSAGKKE